jgi:hypothetical protein
MQEPKHIIILCKFFFVCIFFGLLSTHISEQSLFLLVHKLEYTLLCDKLYSITFTITLAFKKYDFILISYVYHHQRLLLQESLVRMLSSLLLLSRTFDLQRTFIF